jgi:hypothetical protein
MNQPLMNQPLMNQPLMNQPLMNQPLMDLPPQNSLNQPLLDIPPTSIPTSTLLNAIPDNSYPNGDYLYNKITSQENTNGIKTYICALSINKELNTNFVKYVVHRKESTVSFPQFIFDEQGQAGMPPAGMPQVGMPPAGMPPSGMPMEGTPPPGMPMAGGFIDNTGEEEEYLDIIFRTKSLEFAKTFYQMPTEPVYLGYIPNISEPNAVFVFVQATGQLKPEYIESIPNELVFLTKVYNLDIEQSIRDLFSNNKWLYVNQPLCSPFSGYLCKLNATELVNIHKEELATTNIYDQFLINVNGIGNYYYFSFLPLDSAEYQRFVLFPMEYECILDVESLEYYKQNIISYQQSDSLYLKEGVISSQPVFAIKTTNQFTLL